MTGQRSRKARSGESAPVRRECRRCRVVLREGENWVRRWRKDRPGQRTTSRACRACERAEMAGRSRRGNVRFGHARRYARSIGQRWGLSFARYRAVLTRPCWLCAGALSATGVGLDRVDRRHGFLANNVEPACGPCLQLRARGLAPDEVRAVLAMRALRAQVNAA